MTFCSIWVDPASLWLVRSGKLTAVVGRDVATCYKSMLSSQVTVRYVWRWIGTRFRCSFHVSMHVCVQGKQNHILFLNRFILLFMYVHVYMWVCACSCGCPKGPEEGVRL